MYELLQHNLDRWVSPDRSNIIMEALKVLENHGYLSAWSEISAYLEEDNDDTVDIILTIIEGIVDNAMYNLLLAHSIEMEGQYWLKTEALKALLLIPNYDDTDTIFNITNESLNPVESFCDLLGLVTQYDWSHYIDFVKAVSPRLIEKINIESVKAASNNEVDLQTIIDEKRKKLLLKMKSLYPSNVAIVEIIDNHFPVAEIDVDTIFQINKPYLISLEPVDHLLAASEIMGLVLLSNNPVDDLLKACKQQYDNLFSDIKFITNVDIALTNLFAEVNKNG